MKTIRKHFKLSLLPVLTAFIITILTPGLPKEARAGEGAAFLGGMVAGHIVGGAVRRSRIRTAAAVKAANEPKIFVPIVGAGHNNATVTVGQPYFEKIKDFLLANLG